MNCRDLRSSSIVTLLLVSLLGAPGTASEPSHHAFVNGIRCGSAAGATGDIFPTPNDSGMIVRIDTLQDSSGKIVGYLYHAIKGTQVFEATPAMSRADAAYLGAASEPRLRSGVFAQLKRLPPDLSAKPCADAWTGLRRVF